MGLEANTSSTYVTELVPTNPTSNDNVSDGDNHIRLLKAVVQRSFPNIGGEVSATHTAINTAATDVASATNASTASTIVKRDSGGNFTATVVTANLIGNVVGQVQGDVYASNGTSVILQNGTDGTDAVFTGRATKAAAIEVDGVANDVEHRMIFGEDNDGINAPEFLYKDSAANFTYNPFTNALTAGSFVGAVALSNVTGLQTALDAKTTLLAVWPIGSIYTSVTSANPSTLFGGNWEAFGAGRVLIGLDSADTDFDAVEETGGAKTHTLTTAEMPSHTHTFTAFQTTSGTNNRTGGGALSVSASSTTASTGGGGAHNNVQPYIVVYMFKRIAD